MPGLIGKAYAEMGGTVHYVGKPHPAVYEACFKALQVSLSLDYRVGVSAWFMRTI